MPTRLNAQIRKVLLSVMLGGIGLFLCLGAGSSPVSRAQQAGTPEPTVFTYSPLVANLIAQVQSADVYSYTARLSGEAPVVVGGQTVTLTTRYTNSGLSIQRATQYAYEQLQASGLSVSYHSWTACGASGLNVIGVITGAVTPSEIVLITAHLDDMPSTGRAPGADDNASGSVGVLLAAQLMHGAAAGFERTLRFVLFTGEEQGLCGSGAYAAAVYAAGDNIVAVYNLDMIAWDGTGGPTLRLHTRTTGNPGYPADLAIAGVFTNVVSAYGLSGGLTPIIDPDGENRSDHAQFWAKGYPAILAIEDENDFNPHYHTISDALSNINLTYFTNFVKASVGAAAHLARPSDYYTLTVTTTGTGQGVVIAADGTGAMLLLGSAQLPAQIAHVAPGTVITLTAVPSTTSVFAGWSGPVAGLTNPVTVTMNADKVVTATFMIETVTYTGPFSTGQWYTFGAGCGGVYFTSTGSIDAITLTARYVYPGSLGGGLPRRYDIEQHGGGTYEAQVQLCYNHDDLAAAGIPLENEGDLHAYHYSAGSWGEYSVVDTVSNTVTAGPIAMLEGVWGLGITTNKPTIVTLQDLSAAAHGGSNGWVFFAALFALLGLGLSAARFTRRGGYDR